MVGTIRRTAAMVRPQGERHAPVPNPPPWILGSTVCLPSASAVSCVWCALAPSWKGDGRKGASACFHQMYTCHTRLLPVLAAPRAHSLLGSSWTLPISFLVARSVSVGFSFVHERNECQCSIRTRPTANPPVHVPNTCTLSLATSSNHTFVDTYPCLARPCYPLWVRFSSHAEPPRTLRLDSTSCRRLKKIPWEIAPHFSNRHATHTLRRGETTQLHTQTHAGHHTPLPNKQAQPRLA